MGTKERSGRESWQVPPRKMSSEGAQARCVQPDTHILGALLGCGAPWDHTGRGVHTGARITVVEPLRARLSSVRAGVPELHDQWFGWWLETLHQLIGRTRTHTLRATVGPRRACQNSPPMRRRNSESASTRWLGTWQRCEE